MRELSDTVKDQGRKKAQREGRDIYAVWVPDALIGSWCLLGLENVTQRGIDPATAILVATVR